MSFSRPLSELVPRLTQTILGRKSLLFGKMVTQWADIAGPEMASKTMPVDLKFSKKSSAKAGGKSGEMPEAKSEAVLHLAVQSAFALELSYQKSLLIERLNMFFGYPAIKDIKIIQQSNIMSKSGNAPSARPLTLQEDKALEGMVSGIQENDLQSALKNLGKAILSRKN